MCNGVCTCAYLSSPSRQLQMSVLARPPLSCLTPCTTGFSFSAKDLRVREKREREKQHQQHAEDHSNCFRKHRGEDKKNSRIECTEDASFQDAYIFVCLNPIFNLLLTWPVVFRHVACSQFSVKCWTKVITAVKTTKTVCELLITIIHFILTSKVASHHIVYPPLTNWNKTLSNEHSWCSCHITVLELSICIAQVVYTTMFCFLSYSL